MKSENKNKQPYAETPLMKQYNTIKAQYPDALLLFRVGDFYETFGEDAIKTAQILGIVLTKRANGAAAYVELAGFPYHALDNYLPKLVRAGYRVAICDQLEDPKLTKTIVKRGVTELVTPGLALSDKLLDHQSNSFLCAVHVQDEKYGSAFVDLSTGEFFVAEGNREYIEKLIQSLDPGEILLSKPTAKTIQKQIGENWFYFLLDDWVFQSDYATETLLKQFKTQSLKGFGVDHLKEALIAAGACLHYLKATQHDRTNHISSIVRLEANNHVWLDKFTIRNLELFKNSNETSHSFFDSLNNTRTPMGARLLKRWVSMPMKQLNVIHDRLSVVDYFYTNEPIIETFTEWLKQIGDLERLAGKVALQKAGPRELLQLTRALQILVPLKKACLESGNQQLMFLGDQINTCELIKTQLEKELLPDAPSQLHKGDTIAFGVSAELDELRLMKKSGKDFLIKIQEREQAKTGITSLKISFNNVFGYYLEVTNSHKDKVPVDWIRKQTLVNAERYITPELKEFEEKILTAEDKIAAIEQNLYSDLMQAIAEYIQPIQHNASLIAKVDCLLGFAALSHQYGYHKPVVNDSKNLNITDGRHPVIERLMKPGESYVSNSVSIDPEVNQVLMITGPNMSGKSALLRQTALIVMMAQIGCYVSAQSAEIGLVDKIFTRVGASDNLTSGESTFMVEMNETSAIMNNISDRSLILLDEIGRGTSTYDGISIAWSIAEYLHEHPQFKAKTLFATHYHELNDMTEQFKRIKNYNVAVKEMNEKVIFLRKLKEGGSNHSFGIHVARMAGMPRSIIDRAKQILVAMEKQHKTDTKSQLKVPEHVRQGMQLSIFQLDDPLIAQIRDEIEKTDIDSLTPMDALIKLNEIKKLIKK